MKNPESMKKHFSILGIKNKTEYFDWCLKAGFVASLNKTERKLSEEQSFTRVNSQMSRLCISKKVSLSSVIEQIKKNENRRPKILGAEHCLISNIYDSLKAEPEKASLFLDVIVHLDSCSKLTEDKYSIESIKFLVLHSENWLRSYKKWNPKTRNRHKQKSEFIRYLLAKYKIPTFMDSAWDTKPGQFSVPHSQEWFIHMGKGQNIRTAEHLPCALSKKEAHHFLKAPDDYTILEAIRWGQIRALGGNLKIINALRATKLMKAFVHNDFCIQVIKFFIENPMLDRVHVNPIIDYIWSQKFESRNVRIAGGGNQNLEPVQPNFSMTGRSAEALLNQVERWHRQLGKESKGKNLEWEHHPTVKDFKVVMGNAKTGNLKVWKIEQLLNHNELRAEGRAMTHCVSSYAYSCHKGSSFIWSMSLNDSKQITIEMSKELRIEQIRGRFNRVPTFVEKNIIKQWAKKEQITIANFLD